MAADAPRAMGTTVCDSKPALATMAIGTRMLAAAVLLIRFDKNAVA
jgi:hypothetical protein